MALIPAPELLRLLRNADWQMAISEWQASHGAARAYWRQRVLIEVANERRRIADYTAWLRAQQTQQMREAA